MSAALSTLLLIVALAISSTVPAAPRQELPPIDRVGFAPVRGTRLPVDAAFVDAAGAPVRFGHYVGERPVLLVAAYYGCSNLCGVVLASLVDALARANLHAGRDVDVVVFSIDPFDTSSTAQGRKRAVLNGVPAPDAAGWHFLTAREDSIHAMVSALHYRYAYDESQREFAHAAGLTVVAPGGYVVETLSGVSFPAEQLRNAIDLASAFGNQESAQLASAGGIPQRRSLSVVDSVANAGNSVARGALLLCFHYDPHTGRYSFMAMNAVRIVAALSLIALVVFFVRARHRERGAG